MSAIPAVSRQIKTMADGTLRLSIDIEPTNAQEAFQLFGAPDVAVAIARLNQESFVQYTQEVTVKNNSEERVRLSGLSLFAVQACQEPDFWAFLNEVSKLGFVVNSEDSAAKAVMQICSIESRKELMDNQAAIKIFHEQIRLPYGAWLDA